MNAYQPGRSMSVTDGRYTVLYTVDQHLLCYDGDALVDIRYIPLDARVGLLKQMGRLEELDAASRKDAWVRRWRNEILARQALYCNVDLTPAGGYDEKGPLPVDMTPDERRTTDDIDEAQVVSSQCGDERLHRPVLDIDFPVHVYPSTTEGHNHLYLDRVMTWEQYEKLLVPLGEANILEPGYVAASLARKHTAVRLPWIKKEATTS